MSWLQKIAITTVLDSGGSAQYRHFLLHRGKLWMWSDDMPKEAEQILVDQISSQFETEKPPFSRKFDSQYDVRDMWESGDFFRDEDRDRAMKPWTSTTLKGQVSLSTGEIHAYTITGLPVHPNHPELIKLYKHLKMSKPETKDLYYHGFNGKAERILGTAQVGLLPLTKNNTVSNHPKAEYDKNLVYLAKHEVTAKGHACHGSAPYGIVVAVKNLDPAKIRNDFDAENHGYKLNRVGLLGYAGMIPHGLWEWVKIYRTGYNHDTTPLLLTLSPQEYVTLGKQYAKWWVDNDDLMKNIKSKETESVMFGVDWKKMREVAVMKQSLEKTDPIAATFKAKNSAPLLV